MMVGLGCPFRKRCERIVADFGRLIEQNAVVGGEAAHTASLPTVLPFSSSENVGQLSWFGQLKG
jgi:hypothetical protein